VLTSASAGMQTACIELRRQCLRIEDANSSESSGQPHRIIYKLREVAGRGKMGGTMRLGAWT